VSWINYGLFYFHLFSKNYENYFEIGVSDQRYYKWAKMYKDAEYWGSVLRSADFSSSLISKGVILSSKSKYDYLPT
jgi:hypothetical protein